MTDLAATPPTGVYTGRTVHVRFKPFVHRLSYDLFQILVDIDHLERDLAPLTWLKLNRFGPMAFHEKDHGDRSGAPLRAWVERMFGSAGIDLEGGPVRLLCFPRVLGYVFNPISVFFGYTPDGRLAGVIYEVNNTFGATHSYVAPASGAAVEHQEADKVFHVSPFFDMSGHYGFTLRGPGETLGLTITKQQADGPDHVATLKTRRAPLSDAALRKAFFAIPFLTLKVIAGIHWEALKLLLKGARYHHPSLPPAPASLARLSPGQTGHSALRQPQSGSSSPIPIGGVR
ncbi:MAG: DUF1365 domain-containing protein [Hyphomonadaceae bacterium]|nr:DUF1365 domain-containing protein [Hyphomonadaceae bacterium]